MINFGPQTGIKPLLPIYGFTTLILIPTFIIFISTKADIIVWCGLLLFSYTFISIAYFIAQKTTRYWIEGDFLHYKTLFLKGKIAIHSIRKLEVNTSCWLSNKPSTSNTKGIIIYFNKYDDTFITPENNTELVNELVRINPTIEVFTKDRHLSKKDI
ncbi:PH domain-containing protein [Sphingobacterium wenxiniae]|uniref:PH domain-containing protein n=1 Tax=Sphingobacterium wenxiniae TaxID=683125 RepID=A0A1I6RBB4_9SPHI|nr:PH domain-containing protein [Sphingobacterium wenxiniae]SFS62019.1 PH domain-containing protein [Sphingobacterium wenxiniae]